MQDSRRNYILMFIDTLLFINSMVFLSVNAVIPYFLSGLGANTFSISLASALVGFGAFVTQPLFAQMALGLPIKHRRFSGLLLLQRLIFLAYVVSIPFLHRISPRASILLFLSFWGIFNLFVGCYSPFYMSVIAKIIPASQRGRLIGFSGAAANLLALGSAFVMGLLLNRADFPQNYVWIFGIGALLLLADAGVFAAVREQPEAVHKEKVSYYRYVIRIPQVLREYPDFAKAVLGNVFLVLANILAAFITLFAIRRYQAGPADIAAFTALAILANTAGSGVFGIVADRFGHRHVLKAAAGFSFLAVLSIMGIPSLYGAYAAFAMIGLSLIGYNISFSMHIIEHSPQEWIPLFVSINTMITLLLSSAGTLLSGLIIDNFSFMPIFVFSGIAAAAGFLFLHKAFRRGIQTKLWYNGIGMK